MRVENPPQGFVVLTRGRTTLLVDRRYEDQVGALGLDSVEGLGGRLATGRPGPGRGKSARLPTRGGAVWVLKQLRRGGVAAPLWRDRFLGAGRLMRNLTLPLSLLDRGVATPRPTALLVAEGPRGLYRGWIATEEYSDGRDLGTALVSDAPPGPSQLVAAMELVRAMHDVGFRHRDLNISNIMVRGDAACVIDLDGGSLAQAPLSVAARVRQLRRLERSFFKLLYTDPRASWDGRRWWNELYAGGDEELRGRLARGARRRAVGLAIHRVGWRRRALAPRVE